MDTLQNWRGVAVRLRSVLPFERTRRRKTEREPIVLLETTINCFACFIGKPRPVRDSWCERARENFRARNVQRALLALRQIGQNSEPVIEFFAFSRPEIILPLLQKTCGVMYARY